MHPIPTFLLLAALATGVPLAAPAQVYNPAGDDHPHPHPEPLRGPEPAAGTPPPALPNVSATLYTAQSELYAEFKPLVVGQTSRFTAHLTKTGPTFRPYPAGKVTVTLQMSNGGSTKATVGAPEAPGIFRVPLQPTQAGTGTLLVEVVAPGLTDRFTIPGVVVYADAAAARQQPRDEEAGDVAFIKEKSWVMDFATQPLARGTIKKGKDVLPNVMVLPLTAFVNIDGFPHVYVQRTGERFQLRQVQTGPGDGQQVQVLGGVQAGERVVVKGAPEILRASPPAGHDHAH